MLMSGSVAVQRQRDVWCCCQADSELAWGIESYWRVMHALKYHNKRIDDNGWLTVDGGEAEFVVR